MQRSVAQSPLVLITDNGTHSAEKWAEMISKLMISIDPKIEDDRRPVAERLQQKVAAALVPTIQLVIDAERLYLTKDDGRYADAFDGHAFVPDGLAAVYKATDHSMWGDYIRDFDDFLRWELTRHFDHVQHVERLWHADNHDSEAGRKYRLQHGE